MSMAQNKHIVFTWKSVRIPRPILDDLTELELSELLQVNQINVFEDLFYEEQPDRSMIYYQYNSQHRTPPDTLVDPDPFGERLRVSNPSVSTAECKSRTVNK